MTPARTTFNILLILATLAAIALLTLPTRGTEYTGTVMFFTSDEGIEKAAVTIVGPANAVTLDGIAMLPELKLDNDTHFLAVLDTTRAQQLRETQTLTFLTTRAGTTRKRTLPLDRVTTLEATDIRREDSTIVITTHATAIAPGTRVLVWTTVKDTKLTIAGIAPSVWLPRRIGTGGYWAFDFPDGLEGTTETNGSPCARGSSNPRCTVDFRVTPPSLLEGEPVEDIVETILTKVEDFQLVILPPKGHASVTNVRLSLAQAAASAAGDETIESEARGLLTP